MAEIKSLAELKKQVKGLYRGAVWKQSFMRNAVLTKEEVLNLINSFEAGVRERLKKQMKEVEKGSSIQYELFVEARAECSELRRLLEGEGGEKEKGAER